MAKDSISARPMIMATWIRPAAEGCRPIASSALTMARLCAIPAAAEAMAMANPPVNTDTTKKVEDSDLAPSAAKAAGAPAASTTVMNSRTSAPCVRLIDATPFWKGTGLVVLLVFDVNRSSDIDHREHHKDEGLDNACEETEGHHDGQIDAVRNHQPDQREKNDNDAFLAEDIAEQPDREGDRPSQVANELDRKHDGGQPQDRPAEMAQVPDDPLPPAPAEIIGDEDRDGQRRRGVEGRRRRLQPGDRSQQIADENEEACGADQGEVPFPLRPDHLLQQVAERLDDHLHEILHRSRNRLELSCGQIGQADQDRHHKPGHRDMLRHPSSRNPEHPEKIRNLKDGRMVLHVLPRPLCATSYRTLE